MADGFDCDVLVVGLGPVGAALTALLAQRGVQVIAIDKDPAIYPLPRAVHFDHEIMRLFQQLGLVEEVMRHARDAPDYEFRAADGSLLLKFPAVGRTPSGWGAGYMFHQPGLENALRELIARSDAAETRLGVALQGFAQEADAVRATVTGPSGPAEIRARYLVGCDGARSAVRETIGGGLYDYEFDEPWLVVDVKASAGSRMPMANVQLCDPARPTTCVQGGPGWHRWEFMLLPGETPEAITNEAVIEALIRRWGCGPVTLERKAVYRFHGLVANRWRSGRAMIAGDAAHQTPPFAGQGMCSGLRDAANLVWKLDAVLRARADDALLDTYQAEREPHARALIELAIRMGRIVCTRDPMEASRRDANMLAAQASGAPPLPPERPPPFAAGCVLAGSPGAGELFPQPVSRQGGEPLRMDDLLGCRPWLLSRVPAHKVDGVRTLNLACETLAPFRGDLETWLDGRSAAKAVLVRPDRYVFGTGEPRALTDAWAKSLRADA
jgi:3-(3-hydroxy-phenyl)propionate hydroxylase